MIEITDVRLTCISCPTLWGGFTADGKSFYARFRHGQLRVSLDGDVIFNEQVGDEWSGTMEYADLVRHTQHLLKWPETPPPALPDVDLSE